MDQRSVRHARALIREHGIFIQVVVPGDPLDPTYAYTVGMQRAAVPRPEVIVFGVDPRHASRLLNAMFRRVRGGGPLLEGQLIADPVDGRKLRVEAVQPQWVPVYAGMVAPVLDRRAAVPMLQLVRADAAGRWPEDADVDPALLAGQPLLGCDPPWRVPIVRTDDEDRFFVEQPHAELVAVPVAPVWKGRYELLRALPVTAQTMRISDVPWVADHVTYGDLIETATAEGIPGLPEAARVMQAVTVDGPWRARGFRLRAGLASAELAEVTATLWALVDAGHTRVSTTRATVHVNTVDPTGLELAVRPFVRDGLLVPSTLRSEPDPFGPSPDDCPDCQAARRLLADPPPR